MRVKIIQQFNSPDILPKTWPLCMFTYQDCQVQNTLLIWELNTFHQSIVNCEDDK